MSHANYRQAFNCLTTVFKLPKSINQLGVTMSIRSTDELNRMEEEEKLRKEERRRKEEETKEKAKKKDAQIKDRILVLFPEKGFEIPEQGLLSKIAATHLNWTPKQIQDALKNLLAEQKIKERCVQGIKYYSIV
jgi:hypothetical protein